MNPSLFAKNNVRTNFTAKIEISKKLKIVLL